MKRRAVAIIVQFVGFAIGVALLWWCLRLALADENRAAIVRLRESPAWAIAAILGLSALSLMLNGLAFLFALRPVRRLPAAPMLATNAFATFLAYLPFKISAIARVIIHRRRDGVPLVTIGAWFAAVFAIAAACVGPPAALAAPLRDRPIVWAAASVAGVVAAVAALILIARAFRGERGGARVDALTRRISVLRRERVRASIDRARGFFDMASSVRWVAAGVAVRGADIGVQAARFALASWMVGTPVDLATALIAGATFFLIGAAAPSGMLGVREGGTAIVAGAAAGAAGPHAGAALLVGAADLIVNVIGAAIALPWHLSLLRRGASPRSTTMPSDASPAQPDQSDHR